MNIVVLLKVVPDVVEELEIAPGGAALDTEYLRMVPSESDDHALEQALILKEKHGGSVTVVALEARDVDDALYHTLARGADRAIKIVNPLENCRTREAASIYSQALHAVPDLLPSAGLLLTGVQAIDDLDGLLGPLVALDLGLPFLEIVTALSADNSGKLARATREFPGGIRGEFEIDLPAVVGIQAAERPPRYVPVAKVRAVMKSQKIETVEASPPNLLDGSLKVLVMRKPEPAAHAEMLEGPPDQVAARLSGILSERGLV